MIRALDYQRNRFPSRTRIGVEQLLHEARGMRARAAIHTVVVCRAFDWQNDSRLRQLMPPDSQAQVEIVEFTIKEARTILTDAGFDPALFLPRQLELLRLPQNLSLFIEAGFDASRVPAFGTACIVPCTRMTEILSTLKGRFILIGPRCGSYLVSSSLRRPARLTRPTPEPRSALTIC